MNDNDNERYLTEDYAPPECLAPPEVEQWQLALCELREILETLEDIDFHYQDRYPEAEEAIDYELYKVANMLHDALDDIQREYGDR